MATRPTIVLYGRERGESFLARAREHARARFGEEVRLYERSAPHHRDGDFERAVAVYVEECFPAIADGYRRRGVPVVTDADLMADEATRDEYIAAGPIPITAGRRGRRRVA